MRTIQRVETVPSDPLVGSLIDRRYLIQRKIARGGMATVYEAIDERLQRPVAIKVMHPHLAEDAGFTKRFIQEARQAARLAHPNIVNVFDQGQDGVVTFIVMEYLQGITLRDLLAEFEKLNPAQTLDIVKSVLQGLDAAHSAGIVHRDLKPENILLADDGRIKIADFGLARASTHNTSTSQALLGTIAYLSPELISRGEADLRSDIYALGIIIFEMLTGQQPFKGDQAITVAYQHRNDVVPMPSSFESEIPPEFDNLVEWCSRREPTERPANAKTVLKKLSALEKNLSNPGDHNSPDSMQETVAMTRRLTQADQEITEVLDSSSAAAQDTEGNEYDDFLDQNIPTQEPVKSRGRPKGRVLAVLSSIAVLGVLGVIGGWWWLSGPGSLVAVPDVVGKSVAEASNALVGAELTVASNNLEEFDLLLPEGTVKGTTPEAGVEIEKNSEIRLIVSLGPSPVLVPSLAGRSLDQTRLALEEINLILGQTAAEFSDLVDEGSVLRLSDEENAPLPAGSQILAGSKVNVVVSAGSLPNVEGLPVDQAREKLSEAGILGVVGGDGAFSDSVEEGHVVELALPAGMTPQPGDTLTMIVSRGPELIAVPDLVGKTIAEAKNSLETLGFEVEVRSEFPEADWDRPFARVTSLSPTPGQEIAKGTLVIIRSFV